MLLSTTAFRRPAPPDHELRTRRETSGDRDDQRLQSHQARPRVRQQELHLQPGARRPARVDGGLGEKGDVPTPQRVGGHLLADREVEAGGRARLPRPLLPRGVRRPGRRLLLLAGSRRVHELHRLRRHQHGLRRADRHGPPPDPPARHRGAEAPLPRTGPQGREGRLPGDHRAGRRLRRRGHPHHGDSRRRRIRHQRLQDLHHQRAPRRLHRARREDRPRGAARRHHPLRRRPARRERREGPRLQRLRRAGEDGDARLRHRRAGLRRRPRPGRAPSSARKARASTTSPGSSRASAWSPPPAPTRGPNG